LFGSAGGNHTGGGNRFFQPLRAVGRRDAAIGCWCDFLSFAVLCRALGFLRRVGGLRGVLMAWRFPIPNRIVGCGLARLGGTGGLVRVVVRVRIVSRVTPVIASNTSGLFRTVALGRIRPWPFLNPRPLSRCFLLLDAIAQHDLENFAKPALRWH
jgi:hypothetical protein